MRSLRFLPFLAFFAFSLAVAPADVRAQAQGAAQPVPSVDEVMRHLDRLFRADSSRARVTMEINTRRFSRTLTLDSWSKGEDYALAVIRSPAREAGTATLRNPQGLWNYAPRADRLMRIPAGMMSDSWMGSHFTNDDMMRESSWQDDYDTQLSWVRDNGQRVLRAVSVPKPGTPVVWTRIVTYMRAQDWVPIRAEYYDGATLTRTMRFSNIETIDGRPVPTRMELIPHDQPGERTVMTYENLRFDVDISDSLFTHRGLRREAQRR
jgi:hypothetical protein